MVLIIIAIKVIWIRTELKFSKERFNLAMFKTNFIEALILVLQILVVYVSPLPKTSIDGFLATLGVSMFVLGVVLVFWARKTMQQSWGIPGEHAAKQNALVTSGPFSFSRNPLYVGFLLIYFGFAIAIKSWLIILRIPLVFYFYKSAVKEEILLEKMFGKEYVEYKKKVPRFV